MPTSARMPALRSLLPPLAALPCGPFTQGGPLGAAVQTAFCNHRSLHKRPLTRPGRAMRVIYGGAAARRVQPITQTSQPGGRLIAAPTVGLRLLRHADDLAKRTRDARDLRRRMGARQRKKQRRAYESVKNQRDCRKMRQSRWFLVVLYFIGYRFRNGAGRTTRQGPAGRSSPAP